MGGKSIMAPIGRIVVQSNLFIKEFGVFESITQCSLTGKILDVKLDSAKTGRVLGSR